MTVAPGSGIEVARPTGVCAATGRPLQVGQLFVAALVERDSAWERLDYSVEAWDSGARPGNGLRLIGSWRSVMPRSDAPRKTLVDDADLLDLFEQLSEAADHRRQVFRYILALILIRKRLLRVDGVRRGSLLVRPKGADAADGTAPIEVRDPGMDEAAIAEAIDQLSAVIAVDAPPSPGGAG